MATMATRLKVAWDTMFMPRRPVRYETAARIIPKVARPASCTHSPWARPKRSPSAITARTTPAARAPPTARSGVNRRTSAFRSSHGRKLLHCRRDTTVAMAMTTNPAPCDPPVRRWEGPLKSWMSCWNGAYMMATRIWPPMPWRSRSVDDRSADRGRARSPGPWVRLASQGAPMNPIHRPTSVDTTYHSGGPRRWRSPSSARRTCRRSAPRPAEDSAPSWPTRKPATA